MASVEAIPFETIPHEKTPDAASQVSPREEEEEVKVIYEQGETVYAGSMRGRNVFLPAQIRSTKVKALGTDPDLLTRRGVIKLSHWRTTERENTHILLPPLKSHPLVPMNDDGVPDPILMYKCVGSMGILQRHLQAIFNRVHPEGLPAAPVAEEDPPAPLKQQSVVIAEPRSPEDVIKSSGSGLARGSSGVPHSVAATTTVVPPTSGDEASSSPNRGESSSCPHREESSCYTNVDAF